MGFLGAQSEVRRSAGRQAGGEERLVRTGAAAEDDEAKLAKVSLGGEGETWGSRRLTDDVGETQRRRGLEGGKMRSRAVGGVCGGWWW